MRRLTCRSTCPSTSITRPLRLQHAMQDVRSTPKAHVARRVFEVSNIPELNFWRVRLRNGWPCGVPVQQSRYRKFKRPFMAVFREGLGQTKAGLGAPWVRIRTSARRFRLCGGAQRGTVWSFPVASRQRAERSHAGRGRIVSSSRFRPWPFDWPSSPPALSVRKTDSSSPSSQPLRVRCRLTMGDHAVQLRQLRGIRGAGAVHERFALRLLDALLVHAVES